MRRVRAWNPPSRVFHWLLAFAILLSWLTAGGEGLLFAMHAGSGYLILLLVLVRLAWGAGGQEQAGFGSAPPRRRGARGQGTSLLHRGTARHAGADPLGGWAVVLLFAAILLTGATGIADAARGAGGLLGAMVPRGAADAIGGLHATLGKALAALAAVYLAGVLLDWLLAGAAPLRALIARRKEISEDAAAADARTGSVLVALATVGVLGALALYLLRHPAL